MMSTWQQMFRDQEPGDLVASLKHSDIDVRWRAARILGAMGGQACDLLMKALYDDDKGVRILAAWALGRTGDPRESVPIKYCLECFRFPAGKENKKIERPGRNSNPSRLRDRQT